MATPSDLQTQSNAIQWTNGRGLITGAMLSGLVGTIIAVLSSMGFWDANGHYEPSGTGRYLTNVAHTDNTGALLASQMPAYSGDAASAAGTAVLTIQPNVVTNAKAAQAPTLTLKANPSGATANEQDVTLSAFMDAVWGTTQGQIVCRGPSGWAPIAGGAAGTLLTGTGATSCPTYQANSAVSIGNKNRLMNGNFALDQRHNGASFNVVLQGTGNYGYAADRWYDSGTTPAATAQQGTSGQGFTLAGGGSLVIGQRISAANSFDLAGSTVTLSALLSDSASNPVTWTAYYALTTDTFGGPSSFNRTQIATGTFNLTPTLTGYSATFNIPSAATKGIEIAFSMGTHTGATFTLNNVQLEPGSIATAFEHISAELLLEQCSAYYAVGSGYIQGYAAAAATALNLNEVYFPVPAMHATPTLALTPGTYVNSSALTSAGLSSGGFRPALTITAAGQYNVPFTYTASAEIQ